MVFDEVHEFIRSLVSSEVFQGLRVDHIDGLYDPAAYLEQLRQITAEETYLVVEKILQPGEHLPEAWPVQGTTGYDFLGLINNLFSGRVSTSKLANYYQEISGDIIAVEEAVLQKKRLILSRYMQGELSNLYRLLANTGLLEDVTPKAVTEEVLKDVIGDSSKDAVVSLLWKRLSPGHRRGGCNCTHP